MSEASRILRILGFVFGGIGLVMMAVALIVGLREAIATEGMLPAQGEVVALQNNKPVVRFQISATSSVTVVGTVQSRPPAYDIGEKVPVYFDPRDPRRAVIDTFLERWFITTLFAGFAVLFSLVGGSFLLFTGLRNRRLVRLRQHGMKVTGTIFDVALNRFVKLNRKPTWQIIAQWSYNGVSHRTESAHLMQDPRPRLGDRTQIDVWFDPRNPKNAWVDTEFLDPRHGIAQAVGPVQRR